MNKLTKNSPAPRASWLRWGVAMAGAVALVGCATVQSTQSPEAAVTQRSNDYWKARMAGEVAKAYAFTSPGYRAVNDQEKYRLDYGVIPALKGGEIASVTCEEARCEVRKDFTTSTVMMRGTRIPIAIGEVWIKEDGQWWLFVQ